MPAMSNAYLLRRRLLAACLAAIAAPAIPQQVPARYTVEVVVFRQGGAEAPPALAEATLAGGADIEPTPATGRRLGGAATRLRTAGGYQVLGHAAWSQGPAAWNSRRGVSASRAGLGGAVSGKVILERGQYLHLGVDLMVEDGGQRYRIQEIRRVKPDEVQYFDSPALGVIAIVTAGG